MREDTTVYENYKKNYKTKKLGEWDIGFKFIYNEKRMVMGFNNKTVKEKLEIGLAYGYDEEKKIFREGINIYDKELPRGETRIIEIQKVKEYLKKYNISIKDLKETADELLYEKVIGDWEKYTNSRYSKDNLGTVKIERSPLFDGVDQKKEIKNNTNRLANCETVNLDKTLNTAFTQIDAINKVCKRYGKKNLDKNLLELCELRLKNPTLSLKELAEILKISKSGVNHR